MHPRLLGCALLLAACGPASGADDSTSTGTSSGTTVVASTSTTSATEPTTSGSTTGDATTGHPADECPDSNSHKIDGECFCDLGYAWCVPDDVHDLSCCLDTPGTAGATTNPDVTTGDPGDCPIAPPPTCDADAAPFFCDHDEACGPAGSNYYECQDGGYVANPGAPDASCKADGFDFAYGCVTTDGDITFICGEGPGTPCEGGIDFCADAQVLHHCTDGKLGAIDCAKQCQEVGDEQGVTHDSGVCVMARIETGCMCCDTGEPGCPV